VCMTIFESIYFLTKYGGQNNYKIKTETQKFCIISMILQMIK
jgi:hypothetical protein